MRYKAHDLATVPAFTTLIQYLNAASVNLHVLLIVHVLFLVAGSSIDAFCRREKKIIEKIAELAQRGQ